jgi:uncharacterized protein (TIGR02246 family)
MTPTDIAAAQFERIERAWNRADGAAFGAAFAGEADFVDMRGAHHRGDATIGHGHQAIFDSVYAGSTVGFRVDVARETAPGCILAVATSPLDAPSGPLQGVHHSRIMAVITEQGDGWAIAAFQNTLVQVAGG